MKYLPCELEDIIVFGSTFKEHLHNLEEVLTRDWSKRSLFKKKLNYLGDMASAEEVSMDPN